MLFSGLYPLFLVSHSTRKYTIKTIPNNHYFSLKPDKNPNSPIISYIHSQIYRMSKSSIPYHSSQTVLPRLAGWWEPFHSVFLYQSSFSYFFCFCRWIWAKVIKRFSLVDGWNHIPFLLRWRGWKEAPKVRKIRQIMIIYGKYDEFNLVLIILRKLKKI